MRAERALVALALLATGCEQASVQLVWSIQSPNGSALSCAEVQATETHVVVIDQAGAIAHDDHVDCAKGLTTIPLASGSYTATLTLEDAAGNRRAAPAEVGPFFAPVNRMVVQVVPIVASPPE